MNNSFEKNILITGGAGFIGSHVVRLFVEKYPNYHIINLDALTYAGNLENLKDIEDAPNYSFCRKDILEYEAIMELFETEQITDVIHLAAESHVDRSITDPFSFAMTNVMGTLSLLNAAKTKWNADAPHRFYHISTDEVYGSLGATGFFTEETAYDPRSPYSASKASSDHFVRAFWHTYHFPVVISNCSNNYGPNQFPEKLVPLIINNIVHERPLPVYGDGMNVRDWLYVVEHAEAIDLIFHKGKLGETYNIGGHNEMTNIGLVHMICDLMDEKLDRPAGTNRKLITFVKDRPGHDQRYAIDADKLKNELDWQTNIRVKEGLNMTIDWYLANGAWLEQVTSGDYRKYYDAHYS